MNIQGLQKLTLLDFPGHTACTVFTGGCNLRCPFCHNSPLVLTPAENIPVSEDEIFALLEKRRGILDGVAVTGGEPLLQKDIATFLEKIKKAGFLVKLDTNGSFPDRLAEIIRGGLADYIAMDIKNCREKYALTCGIDKLDISPIERSIDMIMAGGIGYEFRTTVVKEFHAPEDIGKIAQWIGGAENYFIQAFKDSGALLSDGCSACSEEDMRKMEEKAAPFVRNCSLRGI